MKSALRMLVGIFSLAVVAQGATLASAATLCDFRNGNPTSPQTILGDVTAGPGCNLSFTTVTGTVTVARGGSLVVYKDAPVGITGNLMSKGATFVDVQAGWIGGDVRIEGTTGVTGGGSRLGLGADGLNCTTLRGSGRWPMIVVDGDVVIRKAVGGRVYIESADIGGDVRVHDNVVDSSNGAGGVDGVLSVMEICENRIEGGAVVRDNLVSTSNVNVLYIHGNEFSTDLHVNDNAVELPGAFLNDLAIFSNVIGRGVRVNENTAAGSSVGKDFITVGNNDITKFLDCRHNTPAPNDTDPGIFATPAGNGNTFLVRHNGRNRRGGGQCDGLVD
jgi:hypothetical protein